MCDPRTSANVEVMLRVVFSSYINSCETVNFPAEIANFVVIDLWIATR